VVPKQPAVDLGPRAVALFADGLTPRKNVLTQALAARRAGAEIHANQVLARGTIGNAARELGATIVDHGWTEDKAEVFRLMAGCKVGLACHFAETFCYAAAEYLALGVVPLVSPAIKVIARMAGDLAKYLVVSDPTDATVIAERLRLLLAHDDLRTHLARLGREYILGEALRWNQLALAQLESEGLR
jgi:glycosyltransferase involved in cell wall biosynthesis